MKILIAGLGSIGRRHLNNLLALGESDIVLYRTHRSTLPETELADIPVETNLSAALAHKPQAVIIANPTSLHMEIAIPAAQHGCHLLLEKPISASLDRVDELQSIIAKSGSQVLVGFQFRFHPTLQQLRQALQQGLIGQPISARAHWGEYLPVWHPWEDYRQGYSARADLGGGVVLTLCHPLDYLCWILGDVRSLFAFTGKLSDLELEVEDTAEIGLRFRNGTLGSVHLDYIQRPPAHHIEIIGTQGSMRWNNTDGCLQIYQSEGDKWQKQQPQPGFHRNDMFLAEMRHFLAVARGEQSPICPLDEGVRALKLALAVHESQIAGKVINL